MSNVQQKLQAVESWRTQYNPLRGLNIPRAVSMLEDGMRGQFADLQWTNEFIEQTDPDLFALVTRWLSAIGEMDYKVKLAGEDSDDFDKTLAEDQAGVLRARYNALGNMNEAIEHLVLASFRGFSIIQPQNDSGKVAASINDVTHLECLDQWNFIRDGRSGGWGWNPQAQSILYSALPAEYKLDASQLIIRTIRRPIDRIGLIKFVRANVSEKDWDSYVEIYGIPAAFVIGPANVPEGKETEYKNSAEEAAEGNGGYLPNGSDIKFADSPRGNQPFLFRLDYLTQKLVLAGTGGLLTMLTAPGSGTLAGSAHMEVFKIIARAEAARISEIMQRWFDRPLLDNAFAGKPRLAYFEIAAKEDRDVGTIVEHASKLAQAGYMIDEAELSEKTGYTLTVKAAPAPPTNPISPIDQTANRDVSSASSVNSVVTALADSADARLQDAARQALAQAFAKDLQPLREAIAAALNCEDDQAMLDALAKIPGELPAMLISMCKDPASQKVLEETLTSSLLNGIEEGVLSRSSTAAPAKGTTP
jgi:phage gp29-like protein